MNIVERRIIILDDDMVNAEALGKRLARRGFVVTVISDPKLLFETMEKEKSEILLLDIVMPDIDGLTVLKNVREKYQKDVLPVIMVTAVDNSFDIVDAFKFGANDYITKPVNVEVALARVSAHLSFVDLHREGIRKKELEAVNAMITTYNHEINNPLSIAISCLSQPLMKDAVAVERLKNCLWRVADIVKKIKDVTDKKEVEYSDYTNKTKMIKVR